MHFRGAVHLIDASKKPPTSTAIIKLVKADKVENLMTLKQACFPEYQKVQFAFKDSMIHGILQFTLLIALRYVLHRCENQEIRC